MSELLDWVYGQAGIERLIRTVGLTASKYRASKAARSLR